MKGVGVGEVWGGGESTGVKDLTGRAYFRLALDDADYCDR